MQKLSSAQLDRITQHIQQTNSHQALQPELLDHIATLIEQRMDQGQSFTDAFDQTIQQANLQALSHLKQLYLQESIGKPSLVKPMVSRSRLRSKRRPATRPFQYMFLSSVLTFLILIGFLIVVSRPLAIPMNAFRTAWGAVGLSSLLILRWWLSGRTRKSKRLLSI